MKFKELEGTLPSGFHDAWIYSVELDYVRCTATLEMGVWWDERDDLRRGQLVLTGLLYFIAEPPERDLSEAAAGAKGLRIDAIDYGGARLTSTDKADKPAFLPNRPITPPGSCDR